MSLGLGPLPLFLLHLFTLKVDSFEKESTSSRGFWSKTV